MFMKLFTSTVNASNYTKRISLNIQQDMTQSTLTNIIILP